MDNCDSSVTSVTVSIKNGQFVISTISPSNLDQNALPWTVLKFAHFQLSKTVPDFEI